jgi:hypothetical protein
MRARNLRSVNWQGALKQKGVKQTGVKKGLGYFVGICLERDWGTMQKPQPLGPEVNWDLPTAVVGSFPSRCYKTHMQIALSSPRRAWSVLWLLDRKDGVTTLLGMLITVYQSTRRGIAGDLNLQLSVRLYAWNSSRTTERICMKFDIEGYELNFVDPFPVLVKIVQNNGYWLKTYTRLLVFLELYSGGSH